MKCLWCGKICGISPGGVIMKYCKPECGLLYRNRKRNRYTPDGAIKRPEMTAPRDKCLFCGAPFTRTRWWSKYCSPECRESALKVRKAIRRGMGRMA